MRSNSGSAQVNMIGHFNKVVNKKTKSFNPIPHCPCKTLWGFSKKSECNNISATWKMIFQASDLKGWQFLKLYDDDNNPIEPLYAKEGLWLEYFGNILVIQTHFVQKWQEQSQTMLL